MDKPTDSQIRKQCGSGEIVKILNTHKYKTNHSGLGISIKDIIHGEASSPYKKDGKGHAYGVIKKILPLEENVYIINFINFINRPIQLGYYGKDIKIKKVQRSGLLTLI